MPGDSLIAIAEAYTSMQVRHVAPCSRQISQYYHGRLLHNLETTISHSSAVVLHFPVLHFSSTQTDINISQGSVGTSLRRGGIFNDYLVANLLHAECENEEF